MLRTLVLATNNRHKVQEISPLLLEASAGFPALPLTLKSAGEFGAFDPEETGSTLEENALIKAQAALALTGEWCISDDTGLEVDALDGRPGIYAARYAGEGCSFADNINKMLGEMKNVPEQPAKLRAAKFICVIALCVPKQEPQLFRAECPGRIRTSASGAGGFGYDPIFEVAGLGKTFAELPLAEKNRISHRAQAVRMLRDELRKRLA